MSRAHPCCTQRKWAEHLFTRLKKHLRAARVLLFVENNCPAPTLVVPPWRSSFTRKQCAPILVSSSVPDKNRLFPRREKDWERPLPRGSFPCIWVHLLVILLSSTARNWLINVGRTCRWARSPKQGEPIGSASILGGNSTKDGKNAKQSRTL